MECLKAVRPKTWMVISLETADAWWVVMLSIMGTRPVQTPFFTAPGQALYDWNEVCSILFWTYHCHGGCLYLFVPIFRRPRSINGLRISGTTIRCNKDTHFILFLLSRGTWHRVSCSGTVHLFCIALPGLGHNYH